MASRTRPMSNCPPMVDLTPISTLSKSMKTAMRVLLVVVLVGTFIELPPGTSCLAPAGTGSGVRDGEGEAVRRGLTPAVRRRTSLPGPPADPQYSPRLAGMRLNRPSAAGDSRLRWESRG